MAEEITQRQRGRPVEGLLQRKTEQHVFWTLFVHPTNVKHLVDSHYGGKSKGGAIDRAVKRLADAGYITQQIGTITAYRYSIPDKSWSAMKIIEKRGDPQFYTVTPKAILEHFTPTSAQSGWHILPSALLNLPKWRRHLASRCKKLALPEVAEALRRELTSYAEQCFPPLIKTRMILFPGEGQVPTMSKNILTAIVRNKRKNATDLTILTYALGIAEIEKQLPFLQQYITHNIIDTWYKHAMNQPNLTTDVPPILKGSLNEVAKKRLEWETRNFHWVIADLWIHADNFENLLLALKAIHPDVARILARIVATELELEMQKQKRSAYIKQLSQWQIILGKPMKHYVAIRQSQAVLTP